MTLPPGQRPVRILVLIEQHPIVAVVKRSLNHGICETREVRNVDEAIMSIQQWQPHLAVVEIGYAGTQLLQRIGRTNPGNSTVIPVLALTRRSDLKTKLTAFEQGVDDVMTVPFSPEELLARVLAIARRTYARPPHKTSVLRLGEVQIDILNREVRVAGEVLHLTGLEQSLLYLLAANAGKLMSRNEILDAIWGAEFVADSNVVDRHIRNLRVKLRDSWRTPRFIATVPGKGYRFLVVSSVPHEVPDEPSAVESLRKLRLLGSGRTTSAAWPAALG